MVGVLVLHQVQSASDVLAVRALGDELEVQSIAGGGGTVCSRVISTLDAAGLGAAGAIFAQRSIKLVTVVAVFTSRVVKPSPVGIDSDSTLDSLAVSAS